MFILYVSDQQASRDFYAAILEREPVLDVPGMTEFELLDGSSLGLMPEAGIQKLLGEALPEPAFGDGGLRAEVYLLVDDPRACLRRAVTAGARLLSECAARDWGDLAGYCLDADGYVLGFAAPVSSDG
ncbi:MAG: VOC family protein [Candidatus Krumholzibacteriota bacterium]